jgi:type I restriction enzyme, R subunit
MLPQHFQENVEPMGFKAFLVAVDRPACAAYKRELDKYLPPEYSKVVYSPYHNDSTEMKEYYLGEGDEKRIRKDFLKKELLPKILIVTQKLLTGFDAPILYCMYLDKPMRDHVLLQAIARVNRPYEDDDGLVKPCGFVLDFVGIFEKLEKALAFDSEIVTSIIQNIDTLRILFKTYMEDVAKPYLSLAQGWDDKSKEAAFEYFADKKVRDTFFRFFKQVQSIYDILSPDAFLRPYINNFQDLARLYALIRNNYIDVVYVDKELTEKTKALLKQNTTGSEIEINPDIHQLGLKELNAIRNSSKSDRTKVLNLRKLIAIVALKDGPNNPILRLIGERARSLAEAYEDRQIETQEALARFLDLTQQYIDSEDKRRKLGLDENEFAIYTELRSHIDSFSPEQAKEINSIFKDFPDYGWDEAQERKLRTKLYMPIRSLVGTSKMTEVADSLLRLRRA